MNEGKRGFKVKRHVVALDKVNQRNPVAKNASAAIGGGAAGAHKDKKKDMKQGNQKHKKSPMADMLEGAAYDRKLEIMLKMSLVESAIMERDPAAYAAAARKSIFQNIGAGMMRDPDDPVRVKADRAIANRERGLERQRNRFLAKQAALPPEPAPDIEEMKARLANLEIRYADLGGDSYQYADRMTERDIEARDIHQRILSLRGAIKRAGGEVAENDLRNPKLVWGPGVRNEVDPEGRSTKFVPKTGTYRVHTGAVGPDQVKQDIQQRIKKGGIAGPKHRLPKE